MFAGFRSRWMMPLLVGRFERLRDLARDRQRVVERNGTLCDAVRERRSFDQFQHESCNAVRFFEAVDAADVWMIQGRERLRFTLKASDTFGIVGERLGQDLDRDVAIEPRIARAIHLAHPAHADLGRDLVGTETSTGTNAMDQFFRASSSSLRQ